jgi:hypothetical protein
MRDMMASHLLERGAEWFGDSLRQEMDMANMSATVTAADSIEDWIGIARELQTCSAQETHRDWQAGIDAMAQNLRDQVDTHGLDAVLKACAWAYLGFNPGYVE